MAEVKRYPTPVFRLSFPDLFEAKTFGDGGPKFGCSAVWTPEKFTDKEKDKWRVMLKAVDAECQERFKKTLKELRALNADGADFKLVPRNGATKSDLEGYGEGTKFANLSTKMRPGVIDKDKKDIGPEHGNAEEIYPGCYCRATVTVYSYDNKGKGVSFGLMNIQKVADGERLDSRTDAAEDFEDDIDGAWLEEGEGDDDDDFLD